MTGATANDRRSKAECRLPLSAAAAGVVPDRAHSSPLRSVLREHVQNDHRDDGAKKSDDIYESRIHSGTIS
jgi:hypothetical protein